MTCGLLGLGPAADGKDVDAVVLIAEHQTAGRSRMERWSTATLKDFPVERMMRRCAQDHPDTALLGLQLLRRRHRISDLAARGSAAARERRALPIRLS